MSLSLVLGFIAGFLSYRGLVLIIRYIRKHFPTEIHVETVRDDKVFSKLKNFCQRRPNVMLMLTADKDIDVSTLERYRELKRFGNPIGLHVHLAIQSELSTLGFGKQFNAIQRGKSLLEKELDISINDFTPGNWALNDDTLKAVSMLGIQKFHMFRIRGNHKKAFVERGLVPISVERYAHDFDL